MSALHKMSDEENAIRRYTPEEDAAATRNDLYRKFRKYQSAADYYRKLYLAAGGELTDSAEVPGNSISDIMVNALKAKGDWMTDEELLKATERRWIHTSHGKSSYLMSRTKAIQNGTVILKKGPKGEDSLGLPEWKK